MPKFDYRFIDANRQSMSMSNRDIYIIDRYRQLARIAMDNFSGKCIEEIVNGLAILDLQVSINELRHTVLELPHHMPQPVTKQFYDVKVVTDKIQAAMNEFIA